MCGFFGIFSKKNKIPVTEVAFKEALKLIKHRGPDLTSVWKDENF